MSESTGVAAAPVLSPNGVKVKDVKSIKPLKREPSAAVALSARQEEPSSTPVRQKEQLLNAQRNATSLFGSFIGRAMKDHGCRPGPAKLPLASQDRGSDKLQNNKVTGLRPARCLSFYYAKAGSKTRPTLARLLSQVPGAEQMNAGRAKTRLALRQFPRLFRRQSMRPRRWRLTGKKVKDFKDRKSSR